MPITTTVEKFPDGRPYVRTWSEGAVEAQDAREIAARISANGDLEGLPLLHVMASKVAFAPEARKVFAGITGADGKRSKMAVVASSAPLRVTLSFVLRLAGMAEHTRFFANEPEGHRWLQAASAE